MLNNRLRKLFAGAGLILLLAAAPAWAGVVYNVTLNTGALPAGSYSLLFQLTDGSGTNDGNNIVTLSNFAYGGGGAVAGPQLWGGASGDLTSGVTLTDNDFFNAIVQGFTRGSQLSYTLDLTTNVDSGGPPDLFAMSVLDANGNEIPTADSSGANTLLTITFDSPLGIQTFPTDPNRATSTGAFITMGAPVLTPVTESSVPEPSSWLLLGTSLAWLIGRQRPNTRRSRTCTE
ncbi:MAG: NF038129 family PEP-CTERM protein [Candidatus Solibacter sp.]|nr:NF038129 family PEP-CTERM protein [Candidatus Solibacter sp.]